MNNNLTFEDYVKKTIDSGINPLELEFFPIIDLEEGEPIAYRSQTKILSIIVGTMEQDSYTYVSDVRDCGIDLLKHSIRHAIKAFLELTSKEVELAFISVRCPSELPEKVSMYNLVKDELDKNPLFDPKRLCLEFPKTILEKDTQKEMRGLLDLKALKVKTAIVGCGKDDFYLSKLATINPDYVYLDKETTLYISSKSMPHLISSLVSYIQSMNIEVIAEGEEYQRRLLRSTSCIGFYDVSQTPMTFEEVSQKVES